MQRQVCFPPGPFGVLDCVLNCRPDALYYARQRGMVMPCVLIANCALRAAGLLALERTPAQLHVDHSNARKLAEGKMMVPVKEGEICRVKRLRHIAWTGGYRCPMHVRAVPCCVPPVAVCQRGPCVLPTVMFAIATMVTCVHLCLSVCSKMLLAHISSLEIIVCEQEAFWNVRRGYRQHMLICQ